MKNKNKHKCLNEYPCSDYLHNALRFLMDREIAVAYEEICWAILKSGGLLTEKENDYLFAFRIEGKYANDD